MQNRYIYFYVLLVLLTACSTNTGRYHQKHDSIPTRLPTDDEMKDPIPRIESPSRGGNKDYQVRGKFYQVLSSASHFKETGIASWYGNKFHGHLTSNGEVYDMYSMSAAHKHLPLPTYVKVTNLDNKKTVIVRVNDRGPFHENRIIDLSYSAAYKLDMLAAGTAHVSIETITPATMKSKTKATLKTPLIKTPTNPTLLKQAKQSDEQFMIQVFATKNPLLAKSTADALGFLYQKPVSFPEKDGLYRIQIGPISNIIEVTNLMSKLKQNGYPNAFKLPVL